MENIAYKFICHRKKGLINFMLQSQDDQIKSMKIPSLSIHWVAKFEKQTNKQIRMLGISLVIVLLASWHAYSKITTQITIFVQNDLCRFKCIQQINESMPWHCKNLLMCIANKKIASKQPMTFVVISHSLLLYPIRVQSTWNACTSKCMCTRWFSLLYFSSSLFIWRFIFALQRCDD